MYKYLPSKKFLLILGSVLLVIIIFCAFSWFKKPKTVANINPQITRQEKVQEFMALDTDADGLKDWEEVLWKTDLKKPDTDNDNTNDWEEIQTNRDPLKQNINPTGQTPSDKIDEQIIATEKKAEEDFSKLSITEKMGRVLFSQYIATQKLNSALTETDKLRIVENTISNLPAINFDVSLEKDLIISSSTDNETLKNYSNSLAKIIIDASRIKTENVENILNSFIEIDNDNITERAKEIFKRFDPIINKNKKVSSDLLALSVPKILANEHLRFLNSFETIYQTIQLIKDSANDVILIVPLLNDYYRGSANLTTALTDLVKKILSLEIKYPNTTDYGYQFFNVIIFIK
jgi:hypothetical protein